MPSPFPGMDPYFEGALWTTFHFAFGAEIIRNIAPRLRPRYLALPVEWLVLEEPGDIAVTTSIYPDSALVAPLQLATVIPQAVPHVSIEIRTRRSASSSPPSRSCRQQTSAAMGEGSISPSADVSSRRRRT